MKLGIVGTGMIAGKVIPNAKDWGWEIAALCSTPRSREKMEQLRREYHIPAGYTDFGAMLQEDLDAVYLAVPNHLHFGFVRQALEAGKNVIVEKPITASAWEAQILAEMAQERNLFLFEAITTLHMPVFQQTRQWLSQIGKVKLVTCNFSQYSSRYDAFCRGEIQPVFDPEKAGGALMDLNVYNLHYVMGLFGPPEKAEYLANVERGIDTSGVVTLTYDGFQAVCVAAKDCGAPCGCVIQGTKGYLRMDAPANCCGPVILHRNDGREEVFDNGPDHRMEPEFRAFAREIQSRGRSNCYLWLAHSVAVSKVLTEARLNAGIRFPMDK